MITVNAGTLTIPLNCCNRDALVDDWVDNWVDDRVSDMPHKYHRQCKDDEQNDADAEVQLPVFLEIRQQ